MHMYKHICTSREDGEDTNGVVQEFQIWDFLGKQNTHWTKTLDRSKFSTWWEDKIYPKEVYFARTLQNNS